MAQRVPIAHETIPEQWVDTGEMAGGDPILRGPDVGTFVMVRDAIRQAREDLGRDEYLGYCVPNAVRLYYQLQAVASEIGLAWDQLEIVRGGLDIPGQKTPETPADLPETGVAHWWVEIEHDGRRYTADLAAELPEIEGLPFFVEGRPDAYIRMESMPDGWQDFAQPGWKSW